MIKKITIPTTYAIENIVSEIQLFQTQYSNPVIIITGPTNSGKTALGHNLDTIFQSRLISCDSRQIFRNLDIGSNKPHILSHTILDGWDTSIVQAENTHYYWHLDTLNLSQEYSAQQYREQTRAMIKQLHIQKILPIVVGGSIHWLRSLMSETISPYYQSDKNLYKQLCNQPLAELQQQFIELYGTSALNNSDWNNSRRLSRAIEYKVVTGQSLYKATQSNIDNNSYLVFQLMIDREKHRVKITESVLDRINRGWISEVENIIRKYTAEPVMQRVGQGYRIIAEYILSNEKISQKELIEKITIAEMRYAKKQQL